MMPDLGRYALEVSLAYLLSLGLIGVLAVFYLVRARVVKRQLAEIETRRGENG